jgi:adenylate cyclase
MLNRPPSLDSVLQWLNRDARLLPDISDVIGELGQRLRDAGMPVDRMTTGVPILHPQITSNGVTWEPGQAMVFNRWRLNEQTIPGFLNSAMYLVYNEGRRIHRRVAKEPEVGEFSIVPELRAAGICDYLALPAPFSDGTYKAVTFATRSDAGFSDDDIAIFESLMPALSMIMEIKSEHQVARVLLDTYVGHHAGGRILDGAIKRGMGETLRAVIWFCDLRGFTNLSNNLPRDQMIDLLNEYFQLTGDAIGNAGGEILKFIGDAVLAIFPTDQSGDERETAARALAAARSAIGSVDTRNTTADRPIDIGIALHVGDVMYGNVGVDNRLDFTVIGPAVNLASRVEGLASKLGEKILISADFADLSEGDHRDLGARELKGFDHPVRIYGVD